MSESQVANRSKKFDKCVAIDALEMISEDELFISGYPAGKIGVVRNEAAANQIPMSLLMFGFKNASTNFFTDDGCHCYYETLRDDQCVCPEEYIPKVERAFTKQKAVLLAFTHIREKIGNESLTPEEIKFLKDLAKKNEHDVYAMLITGEREVAIKYCYDVHEFFTLHSTII